MQSTSILRARQLVAPRRSFATTVVSRRLYQARNPPVRKVRETKKDDDKPWPQYLVNASYVAGVTLIPYFTTWFVVSNPTLRESTGIDQSEYTWIRHHFGEEDPDSISFVDSKEDMDYRYPLEPPLSERKRQWEIDQSLQKDEVVVKVGDESDFLTTAKEEHLPASTLAKKEVLQKLFQTDSPALSFPSDPPEESAAVSGITSDEESLHEEPDPLLRATVVYSPWQYQSPANAVSGQQQPQSQAPPAQSADAIEKSRLEYEISRLETELQKGSNRSIDDIMEELDRQQGPVARIDMETLGSLELKETSNLVMCLYSCLS